MAENSEEEEEERKDNKSGFKVGDIVFATAGRDEGKTFAIVGVIDENYVFIADGKSRKVDSPKKKKIRHIKLEKKAGDSFIQGLNLKGGKLTNSVLRKMISEYLSGVY